MKFETDQLTSGIYSNRVMDEICTLFVITVSVYKPNKLKHRM